MKLSIKENSIDFLKEALTKALASENDKGEWKFALFSVVQSIELALKERLRMEHPSLIFTDIDKQKNTVSIEKATIRLEKISNVKLNKKDLHNIRTATSIRNYIVHNEFELNLPQIESIFGKLVGFLKEFYEEHLDLKISEFLDNDLWETVVNAEIVVNKLYERALVKIESEKIESKFIITCPKCSCDTFIWRKGIEKCYLCGFEDEMTICQECGVFLFSYEAHTVSYGKWRNGREGEEKEWFPDLCDDCFDEYVFNADPPIEII